MFASRRFNTCAAEMLGVLARYGVSAIHGPGGLLLTPGIQRLPPTVFALVVAHRAQLRDALPLDPEAPASYFALRRRKRRQWRAMVA